MRSPVASVFGTRSFVGTFIFVNFSRRMGDTTSQTTREKGGQPTTPLSTRLQVYTGNYWGHITIVGQDGGNKEGCFTIFISGYDHLNNVIAGSITSVGVPDIGVSSTMVGGVVWLKGTQVVICVHMVTVGLGFFVIYRGGTLQGEYARYGFFVQGRY